MCKNQCYRTLIEPSEISKFTFLNFLLTSGNDLATHFQIRFVWQKPKTKEFKFQINSCTQLKYSAFFWDRKSCWACGTTGVSDLFAVCAGVGSLKPLKTVNLALINELMACLFCDLCCGRPAEWTLYIHI